MPESATAATPEIWMTPSPLGPCACSQLRRTARKLSMLYDHSLESAGLTVTQYATLVNIARAGSVGRAALAAKLGMDRTTLTRNLRPLEAAGLIAAVPSDDRRERLLRVSAAGKRKLQRSYGLWVAAQKSFVDAIGPDALDQFRTALHAAELAAESALDARP